MNKLEFKPTFTTDGALLLSIFCGAFIAIIEFFLVSDLNMLIRLIAAMFVFSGVVYVIGFKKARNLFATVKVVLDGNLMIVHKHGGEKDTIEISKIKRVLFTEDTVSPQFGIRAPYTYRYLDLHFEDGSDYQISLNGFRSIRVENLLAYIRDYSPNIHLQRRKLIDGEPIKSTSGVVPNSAS